MQSGLWECSLCHYHNRSSNIFCEMCESPQNQSNQTHSECSKPKTHISHIKPLYINYNQKQQNESNLIQNTTDNKNTESEWKCPVCTFINNINLPYCEVCYYENNTNKQSQNDEYIEYDSFTNQEQKYNIHNNEHIIENENENENENDNKNEIINDINDETATLLLIEQLQMHDKERGLILQNDIRAAKDLDEKYQRDEFEIKQDYKFALKIQREFAKHTIAWFCSHCFTMNIDPKSNVCSKCNKPKPKPKITLDSTPTLKNKISMKIIEIARKYSNKNSCIINIKHALAFITKYYEMSKRLGANKCVPQICYHWTRKRNFELIKQQSLKVPDGKKLKHQTDVGYYGKGIYTSNDPQFAKSYGHGANKLFVCLCINGNMYAAKYPKDKGIGLKHGYDSHMSGDNKDGQMGKQWIFFDPGQLLLIYLVSLDEIQYVLAILNEISAYIHSKHTQLSKSVSHTNHK